MAPLTVRHLMTRKVISVSPATPLLEVHKIISQYNLDGVPVVDATNRLVGIITEYDLLTPSRSLRPAVFSKILAELSAPLSDPGKLEEYGAEVRRVSAGEVMNPEPFVFPVDTPVENVIAAFRAHQRVNPIPVVDAQERLIGIVSRSDVLKALGILYAAPPSIRKVSFTVLRIGIGLTFVWIGVLIAANPDEWTKLIEPWVLAIVPFSAWHLMLGTAVLDMLIGLFLLTGYLVPLVALIAALHLGMIILATGLDIRNVVAARGVGLLAAVLAILFDALEMKKRVAPRDGWRGLNTPNTLRHISPAGESLADSTGSLPAPESLRESAPTDLVAYVDRARKQGASDTAIEEELVKSGWQHESIAAALRKKE